MRDVHDNSPISSLGILSNGYEKNTDALFLQIATLNGEAQELGKPAVKGWR
jgi:hypothetical protein